MNFESVDSLIKADIVVSRNMSYVSIVFFVLFLAIGMIFEGKGAVRASIIFLLFGLISRIKPGGFYRWLKEHGVEFIDEKYFDDANLILVKGGNSGLGVCYVDDEDGRLFLLEPKYARIEMDGDFFIVTDLSGNLGAYNHKSKQMVADCIYTSLKINENGDVVAFSKDKITILTSEGKIQYYLRVSGAKKEVHTGKVYVISDNWLVDNRLKKAFEESVAGIYSLPYEPVCINDVCDVDDMALAEAAKSLEANVFTQVSILNDNVPVFVFETVDEEALVLAALDIVCAADDPVPRCEIEGVSF